MSVDDASRERHSASVAQNRVAPSRLPTFGGSFLQIFLAAAAGSASEATAWAGGGVKPAIIAIKIRFIGMNYPLGSIG
jgi:hypothetical protein